MEIYPGEGLRELKLIKITTYFKIILKKKDFLNKCRIVIQ
jgi:hypothetical protein